jgi:hypothetical protein
MRTSEDFGAGQLDFTPRFVNKPNNPMKPAATETLLEARQKKMTSSDV